MKAQILNWSYRGIRGVNNLDIDLQKKEGAPYQSTLIMMPNGTGKTTTLTLLRAIFNGKADTEWSTDSIKSFDPKIPGVKEGKFTVQLRIDDQNYWVELKLDYFRGTATYSTSKVGRTGGLQYGHHLPEVVKDIFTKEFVKRFIFDGELAQSILKSNSDEAERAIKFLYHIDRLGDLRAKIGRIVEDEQNQMEKTKTKTDQGLTNLRNQFDSLVRAKEILVSKIEAVETKLTSKKQYFQRIVDQLTENIETDEQLSLLANKLKQERMEILVEVKDDTLKILNRIRNPNLLSPAIANRLTTLSDKMQQLKLPKTMSRQFFEELAVQKECICGRSIGEHEKLTIITNAQDYLAEDQIGVINAIKSAVRDRQYADTLENEMQQLKKTIRERHRVNRDWERLHIHKEEAGDSEIQKLQEDKRNLEKEIAQLEEEYYVYTTKDIKFHVNNNLAYYQNIVVCEKRLKAAEEKLAEATSTLKLVKGADKLKTYLERIEKLALKKLKKKIKDETNKKLSQIIRTENIYVEEIERHLVLRDKTGTSVGQSLAIAYSYLGSLFHESTHHLPFVVDSPAGALDLGVRREVSKILPDLFEQLIIFITSGEREGFTEHFLTLGEEVQFLTISKTLENGVTCLEGVEHFKSFQETTN
jgi:DNA sulfur modification protein DndD